jgi:EAL domain-containing protein (putative c-di-GMP-specific phosphodiesterase class I)
VTKPALEGITVRQRFARGQTIFREGEKASCAFVIESGRVEAWTSLGAERKVLSVLGPGEMFGELAALDGIGRSATVTAIEDTEVTLIVQEQLLSRVEAAEPVLRLLLRVILNRFRYEQNLLRPLGAGRLDSIDAGAEAEVARLAIDKMKLESELRSAFAGDELELHYQPLVRLGNGRTAGFEALLRWKHRELGAIPPGKFIPLAEETALIVPIGRFVLERACRDLVVLQRQRAEQLTMSVNVSARQFAEPSFLSELAEVIETSGIDPSSLKLEITEGVLMDHRSQPLRWVEGCKKIGTSIVLDDFGTGFSSLSYLASFPIDTLKIDRSFVQAMGGDPRSLKIVRAINQLAHAMGLDVVAEGIEQETQARELAGMGCELGQGFFFSKGVPLDAAAALAAA